MGKNESRRGRHRAWRKLPRDGTALTPQHVPGFLKLNLRLAPNKSRLQLKLKSRLPTQPEFIQHAPDNSVSPSTERLFDILHILAVGAALKGRGFQPRRYES